MSGKSRENSQPEEETGEPDWEVLEVVDERITKKGKREFYVKWKDQGGVKWSEDQHDEWLKESAMACPELIDQFRERRNADLDRRRKDRSSSRTRKTAKEEKKQRKYSSKARAQRRESEDEDSDIPTSSAKARRKIIDSDDDEDGVPMSTRTRSTVDRDEEQPSTSRVKGRKKTEVERLRITPPPSARRDSQEPQTSSALPPIESLKEVKREGESPEKKKELRSELSKRTAERERRWKKIQKREKKKDKNRGKIPNSQPLPSSAAIDDETGAPLFQDLPVTTVKTEMRADEVVDEMDGFDDLRVPRGGASSSIEGEEPKEGEDSRSGESNNDGVEGGDSASETMEVEEQEKKENKEREESVLEKRGEEDGKADEETNADETKEVKEEEDAVENGDTVSGDVEEEEEEDEDVDEEFVFKPAGEPTGYDLKHKGSIIDAETFEFDTGERIAFCRVLFKALRATQYIAASIVEEKDPMGYHNFLRRRWEAKEQARIKEGAARYRAGRAAADAAAAREAAAGNSRG